MSDAFLPYECYYSQGGTLMSKILIIGGVAGGATAAARLRRLSEKDEIVILERNGYVSFANCGLPYYLGGVIKDRARLLQETPETLKAKFNLDVRIHNEAISIDPEKKTVLVRKTDSGEQYEESYDKLIIATGAAPRKIDFMGLSEADNVYYLRNIEDVDTIYSQLEKNPKKALVVGGGFIGIEIAENFVVRGLNVTLVEGKNQILPPFDPEMAKLLQNEVERNGVSLKLGYSLAGFSDKGHTVLLTNGEKIATDINILAIGIVPDDALAKSASLKMDQGGYVLTNEKMETFDAVTGEIKKDIYAIGDVTCIKDDIDGSPTHIALAGPANRQARLVADVINGKPYTYQGVLGTSIVKVFDLAGGSTGNSEALLTRKGIPHNSVVITRNQHAGYYPGAQMLTLKIIFSPDDGKLLGAQAVGPEGVDKRIDILATALKAKMKVSDLAELELSYAPPYGMAKDIVNIAGYAAMNLLEGQFKQVSVLSFDQEKEGAFLIDARTPLEYGVRHLDDAINIPFVTIRDHLSDLPKDKNAKIIAYCNVGLTAYMWIRVLVNLGYTNVYNLEGGLRLYEATYGEPATVQNEEKPQGGNNTMNDDKTNPTIEIDACGLQCPGPIMEAAKAAEKLHPGEKMKITASDCGFMSDAALWCKSTGNTLISEDQGNGKYVAVIEKGVKAVSPITQITPNSGKTTIVLFSGDMDKALAAMIIAQGTRAMGNEAVVFCTFWGLNLLRKSKAPHVKKSFIERMFGWMMPKGAKKFKLSKMNMLGMGSKMMRGVMKKKNVPVLEEQLANAQKAGVRFLACTMSMDIMGIKKEELIDGIDYVGVATYLSESENAGVTLFI